MRLTFNTLLHPLRRLSDIINTLKPYTEDEWGNYEFDTPLPYEELPDDVRDKVIERLYDINVDGDYWHEYLDESFRESQMTPAGLTGTLHGWNMNPDECAWDFQVDDYGRFAKAVWSAMGRQAVRAWPAARQTLRALLEGQISVSFSHNDTRNTGNTTVEENTPLAAQYPRTRVDWPAALDLLGGACDTYFNDLESEFMTLVNREYEWLTSREAIEDTIEANEYTFDADGRIAHSTIALPVFPKHGDMVGTLNTMDSGVSDLQAFLAAVRPWQVWQVRNVTHAQRGQYLFIVRPENQQLSIIGGPRRPRQDPPETGVRFEHAFWSQSMTDRQYIRAWHAEGADFGATVWASELPARLVLTDWRPLLIDQSAGGPPLTTQAALTTQADAVELANDVLTTGLMVGDTVESLTSNLVWTIRAVGTWQALVAAGLPRTVQTIFNGKYGGSVAVLYWAVELTNKTQSVGTLEGAMKAIRDGKRAAYRSKADQVSARQEAARRADTGDVVGTQGLTFDKMSSILRTDEVNTHDNDSETDSRGDQIGSKSTQSVGTRVHETARPEVRKTQVTADALATAVPPPVVYPTVEELLDLHEVVMEDVGRPPQLRAETTQLLEAAVGRMQSGFGTYETFPTLIEKAACLLHSINTTHVFGDGNKRTSILAAMHFLRLNGTPEDALDVYMGVGEEGLEALTIAVAEHRMTHAELVQWFTDQQRPSSGESLASRLRFADMVNVHRFSIGEYVRPDRESAKVDWKIGGMGAKSEILPMLPRGTLGGDQLRRMSDRTQIVWLVYGLSTNWVTLHELESQWISSAEWAARYEPQRTGGLRFADMVGVIQSTEGYSYKEMLNVLSPGQLWRRSPVASVLGSESLLYVFNPRVINKEVNLQLGKGVQVVSAVWMDEGEPIPREGMHCWIWSGEEPFTLVSTDFRKRVRTADMINVEDPQAPLRLPDHGVKYRPTLEALREVRQQLDNGLPASSYIVVCDTKYATDARWENFSSSQFVRDAWQTYTAKDAQAVLVFCFMGSDHYGGVSVIFTLDDFWKMTRGLRTRASRSAVGDMINVPDPRTLGPRKIRTSWRSWIPDATEAEPEEDWGWEDEQGTEIDLDMADMEDGEYETVEQYLAARTVATLSSMGAIEHANDTDYYGEAYTENYQTGETKELCFHLTHFTPTELILVGHYWDTAHRRHAGLALRFSSSDIAEDSIVSGQPVETEPSEAQIESGNYQKGHTRLHGLDITIENPKGSLRRGTDADGREWSQKLHSDYGYIKGFTGKDGDLVDVFVGEHHDSEYVYVVNQKKKGGQGFDEHKVVLGTHNEDAAQTEYLSNYEDGWLGGQGGAVDGVAMTVQQFKDWLAAGDTKKRVTLKHVQKTMQTSADMINVDVEGPWMTVGDALDTMQAWQLWEIKDPQRIGGWQFLNVVNPTVVQTNGKRLKRGRWSNRPLFAATDVMGEPTVEDHVGLVRLLSNDFRTYMPPSEQRTADMADVSNAVNSDVREWTKHIGTPHRYFIRIYPSSIETAIRTYIKKHMTPAFKLEMERRGYSTVYEMMFECPIEIIGADPVTSDLTFKISAPWDKTLVLMTIDVPLADARMQLFLDPHSIVQAAMPQPVRNQLDYPNFAAVAAQLTAAEEQALREIVERAGATFNGVQDYGQHGHFVFFTDPQTHSTAILPVQGVTDASMAQKLQTVRERFNG